MSKYLEIVSQIESLKKAAAKAKREEFSAVLKAIRAQVKEFGITAADLGLSPKQTGAVKRGRAPAKRAGLKKIKRSVAIKYRDQHGNTWTGRGKKPKWIVVALSSGQSLDSLRVSGDA
jgi:DNA-binding protein H-NS